MPNELKDIEVDEVSLVDRPATGRRFVLFKRASRAARERETNIRSDTAELEKRLGEVEALRKRAEDAESALSDLRDRAGQAEASLGDLRDRAARLEKRLESIERARPARQSEEAGAPAAGSIWSGIL